MFYAVGRPESLSSIDTGVFDKRRGRRQVAIAIIDDKGFAYSGLLRQHGFDVSDFQDIEHISTLESYDVVVSDIRGVGKRLGSWYEGGHIISEIRRAYPEKYIITFSEHGLYATFKRFLDDADLSIKKDADIEDWVNALDSAIRDVSSPIGRWIRARSILLERLELYDVLQIERAYIRSIKSGNSEILSKVTHNIRGVRDQAEILDIVVRLAGFAAKIVTMDLPSQKR